MTPLLDPSPFHSSDDLGLGLKAGPRRSVNKDGTFNVRRVGLPVLRSYEFYHHLITMDAFFFSAQTLTTVGYGHISPNSHLASAVAALESLLGLLSFALATGLLYGRFSRPHAQIRFSHHAVVAPYQDGMGFMFRFINRRSNQLIEVEATIVLTLLDPATGTRRFVTLALERSRINLFPTSWTVVHPIDEASPLFGMTDSDLRTAQAEFIVLIKAFDDTFAQTIYQRTSYTADEVLWGTRFKPMSSFAADGAMEMDANAVDDTESAGAPAQVAPGIATN